MFDFLLQLKLIYPIIVLGTHFTNLHNSQEDFLITAPKMPQWNAFIYTVYMSL